MDIDSPDDTELAAKIVASHAAEIDKKEERTPKRVLLVLDGLGASFHRALAEAIASRNMDVVTAHEAQVLMREPELPEIEMMREFDKHVMVRERAYNRSVPFHQQNQSRYKRQHRGQRR